MKLVVDANRVVSALLKDGSTRAAFFDTTAELFAPEDLVPSIQKHLPEIRRRAGLTKAAATDLLDLIVNRIRWVERSSFSTHLPRAMELMKIDPEDAPYLACAFAVDADAVWSMDPHFDSQTAVPRIVHPEAVEGLPEGSECDARCRRAWSDPSKCKCICGGKNHGIGPRQRAVPR